MKFEYTYGTLSHNTAEYKNTIEFDTVEEMEEWVEGNVGGPEIIFEWTEIKVPQPSRMHVGYDLRSAATAQKVINKLKQVAEREKRFGRYEIVNEGDCVRVYHVLEEAEKREMEIRCTTQGHSIHVSGKCIRCHTQVEVGAYEGN